jgi:hypothetical protein
MTLTIWELLKFYIGCTVHTVVRTSIMLHRLSNGLTVWITSLYFDVVGFSVNDDSDESIEPRRKKTRRLWQDSDSEESDSTWGRKKKR